MKEEIAYTVKKRSGTRKISISVNRAGKVTVVTPRFFSKRLAEKFITSRKAWILEAQEKMREKYKESIFLDQNKKDFEEYKTASLFMIKERISHFNAFYNFKISAIRIKNHATRWGSCSVKGNLNFNYTLIKLPQELADYVIVHELCHLKEMNHSKKFWDLVGKTVPDYKARRKELKTKYIA